MTRSPSEVISHTVPSASTRPNLCGSLAGGAATVAVGRGPGTGPGTGPRGPGRGVGFGVGRVGSLLVISVPSAFRASVRAPAAQRGAMLWVTGLSNAIETGRRGLRPRLRVSGRRGGPRPGAPGAHPADIDSLVVC